MNKPTTPDALAPINVTPPDYVSTLAPAASEARQHDRTPGPWKLDPVWNLILGPDGQEICAIHASSEPPRVGRSEAAGNAALIESAPTLAAEIAALRGALEELIKAGEQGLWGAWASNTPNGTILKRARLALAGKGGAS